MKYTNIKDKNQYLTIAIRFSNDLVYDTRKTLLLLFNLLERLNFRPFKFMINLYDYINKILELAEYERTVTRAFHKYNAYRKAAISIATYPTRFKNGKEATKLVWITYLQYIEIFA